MSSLKNNNDNNSQPTSNSTMDSIGSSLSKNIQTIKQVTGNSNDIVIREVFIGKFAKQLIAIIYTDGLADQTIITDFIPESLMLDLDKPIEDNSQTVNQYLKDICLAVGDVKDIEDFTSLFSFLMNGETVILVDGVAKGISTSTKSSKDRAITEPTTESVIRGPKESFTETLRTNTTLIRRKIKSPDLWIKSRVIGKVTQTDIVIMYINGIANEKIVKEVLSRLDKIESAHLYVS